MKTYQSFKKVTAARITGYAFLDPVPTFPEARPLELTLDDGSQVHVIGPRFDRVEIGGYYVRVDDGHDFYCPATRFENAYLLLGEAPDVLTEQQMTFGQALDALKRGQKVARRGWNGADQWIALGKGAHLGAEEFWNEHTRDFAETNGGYATVRPYFILKTAQQDILMGWSPSQSDALAEDWLIVP
jgi:hypothetical protein